MSRYVINILASRDINEIGDYFAETSIDRTDIFHQTFLQKAIAKSYHKFTVLRLRL